MKKIPPRAIVETGTAGVLRKWHEKRRGSGQRVGKIEIQVDKYKLDTSLMSRRGVFLRGEKPGSLWEGGVNGSPKQDGRSNNC